MTQDGKSCKPVDSSKVVSTHLTLEVSQAFCSADARTFHLTWSSLKPWAVAVETYPTDKPAGSWAKLKTPLL
jgi:hypothetical protein